MQPRDALWPSEGDTDGIIHARPTDCPMPEFSVHIADNGVSVAEAWNKRAARPSVSDEMVEAALAAWFRGSQSETDQGLHRGMRCAVEAALAQSALSSGEQR